MSRLLTMGVPGGFNPRRIAGCKLWLKASAFVPDSLFNGLAAWWELGEASGNRADSHGSNTLTDNNTVTQAVGKVGNAAQFTAANSEHLSIVDNASINIINSSFTVACWVYLDSKPVGGSGMVTKWHGSGEREFVLRYRQDVDRVEFNYNFNDTVTANAFGAPSLATWYFVVAWYDQSAQTLNICVNDGTVNTTTGVSVAAEASTQALYLGATEDEGVTNFLDGRLDQVGLWKRALTAAEITALYNGGSGIDYSTIAGVGTWADRSGQANNATQATAANKPLYKTAIVNGQSVVRFDGSNDSLVCGYALPAIYTAVGAVVYTSGTVFASTDGTNQPIFPFSTTEVYPNQAQAALAISSSFVGTHVVTGRFDHTNDTYDVWRDGASIGSDTTARANLVGNISIGDRSASAFLNGDIAELIVYDSALSTANRRKVERYLGRRYGITVV